MADRFGYFAPAPDAETGGRCALLRGVPDSLLARAVQFLDVRARCRAGAVSQRWAAVASSEQLWAVVQLSPEEGISDAFVARAVRRQRKLRHLDLSDCARALTPAVIAELHLPRLGPWGLRVAQLHVLVMRNWEWLDDAQLLPVLRAQRRLRKLDVSGCRRLTDAVVDEAGFGCPELQLLGVAECPMITQGSVQELVERGCEVFFAFGAGFAARSVVRPAPVAVAVAVAVPPPPAAGGCASSSSSDGEDDEPPPAEGPSRARRCQRCGRRSFGLFKRRKLCIRCGRALCSDCAGTRMNPCCEVCRSSILALN